MKDGSEDSPKEKKNVADWHTNNTRSNWLLWS